LYVEEKGGKDGDWRLAMEFEEEGGRRREEGRRGGG
jgi:hypothetical protein